MSEARTVFSGSRSNSEVLIYNELKKILEVLCWAAFADFQPKPTVEEFRQAKHRLAAIIVNRLMGELLKISKKQELSYYYKKELFSCVSKIFTEKTSTLTAETSFFPQVDSLFSSPLVFLSSPLQNTKKIFENFLEKSWIENLGKFVNSLLSIFELASRILQETKINYKAVNSVYINVPTFFRLVDSIDQDFTRLDLLSFLPSEPHLTPIFGDLIVVFNKNGLTLFFYKLLDEITKEIRKSFVAFLLNHSLYNLSAARIEALGEDLASIINNLQSSLSPWSVKHDPKSDHYFYINAIISNFVFPLVLSDIVFNGKKMESQTHNQQILFGIKQYLDETLLSVSQRTDSKIFKFINRNNRQIIVTLQDVCNFVCARDFGHHLVKIDDPEDIHLLLQIWGLFDAIIEVIELKDSYHFDKAELLLSINQRFLSLFNDGLALVSRSYFNLLDDQSDPCNSMVENFIYEIDKLDLKPANRNAALQLIRKKMIGLEQALLDDFHHNGESLRACFFDRINKDEFARENVIKNNDFLKKVRIIFHPDSWNNSFALEIFKEFQKFVLDVLSKLEYTADLQEQNDILRHVVIIANDYLSSTATIFAHVREDIALTQSSTKQVEQDLVEVETMVRELSDQVNQLTSRCVANEEVDNPLTNPISLSKTAS